MLSIFFEFLLCYIAQQFFQQYIQYIESKMNTNSNKKTNRPLFIKSKIPESLQSTQMKLHHNSAEQSQQEIILKNISTPSKQSLKQNILQRLSGSKNKPFQKKLTENQDFQFPENQETQFLKQQIIKHQNQTNDGFYLYKNWLEINEVLFNKKDQYVQQLWKILRMINFGQVSIPTGLVYEILSTIKSKSSAKFKHQKIIAEINKFLEFNDMKTTYRNFKQLKHFKPLEEILKSYSGEQLENEKPKIEKKQNSAVFDYLYNEAKQRSQKQSMLSILNQKQQMTQCTFSPFISNYTSSEKPQKTYHSKCNSNHNNILLMQDHWIPYNIKPLPFDSKLFNKNIEQIKGASDHILRNMASYQQKLRIKRMLEKPVILKYK